jgi:16S rRNA (guanine527-N7)-methyltransferase
VKHPDRRSENEATTAAPSVESPYERLRVAAERLGVTLAPPTTARLIALLDRIAVDPQNLTATTGTWDAVDRHLADSLAGLTLPALLGPARVVDIGSGAGFPGLALAIAAPQLDVTLIESERRKVQWLERASADLTNVRPMHGRSEEVARGAREQWEVATVRAVAEPPAALELAAPLLATGGWAVLWTGQRDHMLERRTEAAAKELGFGRADVRSVPAVPGAERHLLVYRKLRPTPERFPRRAGRATKRPLA